MSNTFQTVNISWLVLGLLVAAGAGNAASPSASIISVRQISGFRAEIVYRFGGNDQVTAEANGGTAPVLEKLAYPYPGAVTAILFLVDDSGSRRPATIRQNIQDVSAIISAAKPYQRMGIAAFDSSLHMLAPVGSPPERLIAAAQELNNSGRTTELFRSAIGAIGELGKIPADRRMIVIFSDGGAEDTAYHLADAVAAAARANVVMIGAGYAESVAHSVDLQNLRRLGEDSGGLYIEASGTQTAGAVSAAVAQAEHGGKLTIDLSPAASPFHANTARISLSVAGASAGADTTLTIPRRPPTGAELAGVAGLSAALLLGVGALAVQRRRIAAPIAFLEFLDTDNSVYPVATSNLTIGRGADNKLRLANDSVSRNHAAIVLRRDGRFVVKEVVATNGVKVNGKRVGEAELSDGDTVALGEVQFRFRANRPAADRQQSERT